MVVKEDVDLRQILLRGLRREAAQSDIKALVNLFHKAAITYLRMKAASHRRLISPLTLEDVALDAIAELFERENGLGFVKLVRWFNRDRPFPELSNDLLWVAFRRIVFGAVNQHFFRLVREADPSLARILRNIKLALKKHPRLCLVDINGVSSVELVDPAGAGRRLLPELFPEFVAAEFGSCQAAGKNLREQLATLERILHQQVRYRNSLPLLSVALLFRDHQRSPSLSNEVLPEPDKLTQDEILRFIQDSLAKIRPGAIKTYVRTSKVDERMLDIYLTAVRDNLLAEFAGSDGEPAHFYATLAGYLPELTQEEYKNRHRTIVEYLTALARKRLISAFRKELRISA